MTDQTAFMFTCCQPGSETALKNELAVQWPNFRFAFSRPGFVTFKTDKKQLAEDFDLRSVFATTYGVSLGKVQSTDALQMARDVWQAVAGQSFDGIHVWQRSGQIAGNHGFEPGETLLAREVGQLIASAAPSELGSLPINQTGRAGQRILDCVLVEPSSWWYGVHQVGRFSSRYPGGVLPLELPEHAVSRAYLKLAESLEWSRLPIQEGDACVEIGSSPGGSCQAMLDRGLRVTGIDPAEMDPAVLEHPNFSHIRARGSELKRRFYADFKWLMADSSVAPKHTLDTVEHIVTHPSVNIKGLVLTLKLLEWKLADDIPAFLDRIRSWGFEYVKARQLVYNRQEICVAALRRKSMIREPQWRQKKLTKPDRSVVKSTPQVEGGNEESLSTETDAAHTPTPEAPTPEAPTPEAPTPEAPTPEAPTPEAPTPEAPTPEAPTPEAPTPEAPTPEAP
jgi:23S rRNA (cytidine2498-2'-O)-methyltransferase